MRLLRPLLVFLSLLAMLLASAATVPAAHGDEPKPILEPEVDKLLALMERAAPSARAGTPKDGFGFSGYKETPAERAARYREIARAAWEVTGEEGIKLLYSGTNARLQTAAAILGVAMHESSYAKDVDVGPCYRKIEPTRCDSGRAFCMMQIQQTHQRGTRTTLGYTGAELFQDRRKCFREGLSQLVSSQASCWRLGAKNRFSVYAYGKCAEGILPAEQLARDVDSFAARVVASKK